MVLFLEESCRNMTVDARIDEQGKGIYSARNVGEIAKMIGIKIANSIPHLFRVREILKQ